MADNLLKTGLAWLTDQLDDHAAEEIVYSRGDQSVQVRAVIGMKLLRVADVDGGIRLEYTDLDACIRSDLEFSFDGLEPIEPRRGDRVAVQMPYDEQTFQVEPTDGEPCWR